MLTLQQQFGATVRRLRQAAGVGQEKLADAAAIHRTHLSMLERGLRMPTLIVVQKLAGALNTTMSGLLAEVEADTAAAADKVPESKGRSRAGRER